MRKYLEYGLLHAITAFMRVVDARSFTAAASQMELTTAQVSRLVSDLRLVNPSIAPNWELIDGKTVCTLDPTGPVVGDIRRWCGEDVVIL